MRLRFYALSNLLTLFLVSCAAPPSSQSNPTAASPIATSTSSDVIAAGSFNKGEHSTKGGVQIVNQNGKRFLQLDQQFETSILGPDLVVILHRSANVLGETNPPFYSLKSGSYVILARLKQFNGAQTYEIPSNINPNDYKSVAIWCRQFNATFGAATLKA
ncbi:DM13 domain-containing protein [Leptolyngbya sp. NIES-2104]|uniref:DM13 domain-containing protein n=1 Tax=Leptolyngbya sp. NIES-2104 TaxID=1552121 RepID=UPI0006EC9072|nr:DM13 domain-containing protein [Leptolyngbya sp. NIES-2104]GAP93704.1 hypothetical protein NIES2104_02110 [Leptolyngbya sp. NIES-2104]